MWDGFGTPHNQPAGGREPGTGRHTEAFLDQPQQVFYRDQGSDFFIAYPDREVLFKYADKTVLTTGNYDSQVGAFATGQAAFLHQGNWTDPNTSKVYARLCPAVQTCDDLFPPA